VSSAPEERDPYAPPAEDREPQSPPADAPPAQQPLPPPPPPIAWDRPYGAPPEPAGVRGPTSRGPEIPGGRAALFLGLAGLVMSVVVFPVGLVLDIAAIVLGLRARKRAAAAGGHAPGATGAVVAGMVGAVFAAGVLTFLAVFWTEFRDYRECLSGANTEIARERCTSTFRGDVEDRLGLVS